MRLFVFWRISLSNRPPQVDVDIFLSGFLWVISLSLSFSRSILMLSLILYCIGNYRNDTEMRSGDLISLFASLFLCLKFLFIQHIDFHLSIKSPLLSYRGESITMKHVPFLPVC